MCPQGLTLNFFVWPWPLTWWLQYQWVSFFTYKEDVYNQYPGLKHVHNVWPHILWCDLDLWNVNLKLLFFFLYLTLKINEFEWFRANNFKSESWICTMTLTLWLQNEKAFFFFCWHGRHILIVNELGPILWFKICPLGLTLNLLGWSWPLSLWPVTSESKGCPFCWHRRYILSFWMN